MPRYNQYNRNRLSLNTVDFQPTVFNPIEFKPVEQDYSILERAMAKQEERREKAVTQQSLVKQALGKAREQLHPDTETLAWFDNKARNIENNIKLSADLGDYASALETGITAAGDIANDKELNARIRTNTQYNEEVERQRKRINNGISQATFDWWVEKNPYKYNNIYDGEGNVIGGEDWKSDFTPVDDLDSAQLALTAFKLLSPEKNTWGTESNVKPGTKNEYSDIRQVDSGSYDRITVDRIYNNIKEIIGSNPDNWRALRQGFQVALNELDKLKVERDKYEIGSEEYNFKNKLYEDQLAYFKGENNQTLSNNEEGWKLYTSRVITDNMFAQGLAYNWKTSSTATHISEPPTPKTTDSDEGGYPTPTMFPAGTFMQSSSGNRVNLQKNTSDAQRGATQAGSNGGNQMKKAQQESNNK